MQQNIKEAIKYSKTRKFLLALYHKINLKDIIPINITPVDQLSAREATKKAVKYCDVKITCNATVIKSPMIVYWIKGMIHEILKRIFLV